jgi:hypothetical protein
MKDGAGIAWKMTGRRYLRGTHVSRSLSQPFHFTSGAEN